MNRLNGMTETWSGGVPATLISSASYNSASQLTGLSGVFNETRGYNNLMQLTSLSGPAGTFAYNYTAGQNNGRIASMTDSATSETVTYQYDTLNRLIAANSTGGWNTAYGYDGWGNLTSKGGSAGVPYVVNPVDPSTNGSPGAAGFPYSPPNYYNSGNYIPPSPYDVEGRMVSDSSGNSFVYDPWGRRIWQETLPTGPENPPTWNTKLTFYAVNGKRIMGFNGVYETDGSGTPYMVVTADSQNPYATQQLAGTKQYFGGKLIMSDGNAIGTDRLGSVRSGGNGGAMSYYPYGEERTSTPQGQEKFGTYFRDADGNDYAMARRYSSGSGRFMTADPKGIRAARPRTPMRWNRMMYAGGDPVNLWDPSGSILAYAGSSCDVVDDDPDDIDGENAQWDCEDYYSGGGSAEAGGPDGPASSGGGTVPTVYQKASNVLGQGEDALIGALNGPNSTCASYMDRIEANFGITTQTLMAKVTSNNTNNAWSAGNDDGELAIDLISPNDPGYTFDAQHLGTISQYLTGGSTKAVTAAQGSLLYGQIFYNASYVAGLSTSAAAGLIMHETLHLFGYTDSQIQTALGLSVTPVSDNITQALSSCSK